MTGKAFVKFSSDTSRAFFVSLVEEGEREALDTVLLGLCATVKVINFPVSPGQLYHHQCIVYWLTVGRWLS